MGRFSKLFLAILLATLTITTSADKPSNYVSGKNANLGKTNGRDNKGGKNGVVVGVTQARSPNPCANKNPNATSIPCTNANMETAFEQSGVNVTKGYQGGHETDAVPITIPLWKAGLCPVNVHMHLGAEHYSVGQYDENGSGPDDFPKKTESGKGSTGSQTPAPRQGFQCHFYNKYDPKFTTPYKWKHCKDLEVGQTYEVHWPHSSAGACGTPWQYQTPFLDGVFCVDGIITLNVNAKASQIGVTAQVFTIVNDESYFYSNMFMGMIVDGEMGKDIAYYTGSTSGTSFNNKVCSPYAPITWQVDRKCHMISASSLDKMCLEMKSQADDMEADLDAHGSRELVDTKFAANNQHMLLALSPQDEDGDDVNNGVRFSDANHRHWGTLSVLSLLLVLLS